MCCAVFPVLQCNKYPNLIRIYLIVNKLHYPSFVKYRSLKTPAHYVCAHIKLYYICCWDPHSPTPTPI